MPWHSLQFDLLQMGSILSLDNKTSPAESLEVSPKMSSISKFQLRNVSGLWVPPLSLRASESLPPGTGGPCASSNWTCCSNSLGWEGRITNWLVLFGVLEQFQGTHRHGLPWWMQRYFFATESKHAYQTSITGWGIQYCCPPAAT